MANENAIGTPQVILQQVVTVDATFRSITATITDFTIAPTTSDGTEIITQSFTPKSSSSTLYVYVSAPVTLAAALIATMALFDSAIGTDSVGTTWSWIPTGSEGQNFYIGYSVASGSTSARTFSVRVGVSTSTAYINGNAGARLLGGVSVVTLTTREVFG